MHEHLWRKDRTRFYHEHLLISNGPMSATTQAVGTSSSQPVTVGQKVPDFSLRDLDGKPITLGGLQKDEKRGKKGVILLTFWCSFCGSCRRVEHHLDRLARGYEGKAAVVAVDASAGETAAQVRGFAKEKGLSLPIFLDPRGHTADLFGTEVTTTSVVIDGDGLLRYCGRFEDGSHRYAEEALSTVLAGKEVPVKTTPHDG
jgi:thiol-disulfide isomerase/thioredoxin